LMYDIEGFRTVRYLGAILSFSVLLRVTSDDQSLSPLKRWLAPGMVWGILIIALLTQAPRVYNDVITRRLEPKQLSSALGWIEYDPHAKDRWGNTVYLDLFDDTSIDFNYYSVGLGLMYMNLDEMDDALALAPASEALKARYLLTSQDVEIPGYIRVKSDDGMNLFLKSE